MAILQFLIAALFFCLATAYGTETISNMRRMKKALKGKKDISLYSKEPHEVKLLRKLTCKANKSLIQCSLYKVFTVLDHLQTSDKEQLHNGQATLSGVTARIMKG
jgi:hypothetical protein